MGVETLSFLSLGLGLFQAHSGIGAAEDQAEAVVAQGNLQAEDRARRVRLNAATQQSSFLNSGLTLDGTPMSVIQNTFDVGISDINQITSNANKQSKNILSQARTQAITQIAGAAIGAAGGFGGAPATSGAGGAGSFFSGGGNLSTAGSGLDVSGFGGSQSSVFGTNNSFGGFN